MNMKEIMKDRKKNPGAHITKTSHQLSKEFITQFWEEFKEIESKLPCKHRSSKDFVRSCDTCLVYILPTASEMFSSCMTIFEMMEAFVELTNFFVGAESDFKRKVINPLFDSGKIEIPEDIRHSDLESNRQLELMKQSILSNEFLNPEKFNFNKQESDGK